MYFKNYVKKVEITLFLHGVVVQISRTILSDIEGYVVYLLFLIRILYYLTDFERTQDAVAALLTIGSGEQNPAKENNDEALNSAGRSILLNFTLRFSKII